VRSPRRDSGVAQAAPAPSRVVYRALWKTLWETSGALICKGLAFEYLRPIEPSCSIRSNRLKTGNLLSKRVFMEGAGPLATASSSLFSTT
jgi:hypothetical protein